jgi:RNA polymerase sigma-70 factor (ECF subfamily)
VLPHEPALRAWLGSKRLRGVDLDDVVQETYAILVGLQSTEAIRNPRAYAFQTAYSVILHQVRRDKVVSITTADDLDRLGGAHDAPSPETEVADREELHRLAEAIARLPARCREVVVLRKIEGLAQREVAARLGISEGTVEKQIHKGVNLLMAVLGRGGKPGAGASRDQALRLKVETSTDDNAGDRRRNR